MAKEPPHRPPDDSPVELVPIGSVVAALQSQYPDISASSLRFLEREGLVEPHRSAGGHRLYAITDIQRIRQIKEWQARRLSLAEIRSRLQFASQSESASDLHQQVLGLYLKGKSREAQTVLLDADEANQVDLETMFGEVLSPILYEVGERWENGVLEVSQEKETSESLREVIVELSIRHRAIDAQGPVVVAATVLGELHELGLRMVCGILGAAGFSIIYLGANAAPEHVGEAVRRHEPAAVLLSIGSPANLLALRETIDTITAQPLPAASRLLVGGAGVYGNESAILAMGATPVTETTFGQLPTELTRLLA